jgi:hypothetical protein
MILEIDKRVSEIMEQEDYKLVEVTNGEEYFKFVDRYEIRLPSEGGDEVEEEAPRLKALEHKYPLYLPYTRSVVRLNDLFGEFLELNLNFW